MLTFSDLATLVMIETFKSFRSAGYDTRTDITYDMIWQRVNAMSILCYDVPKKFRDVVARIAFAVAMTEMFPIDSMQYNAWREYELFQLQSATDANS